MSELINIFLWAITAPYYYLLNGNNWHGQNMNKNCKKKKCKKKKCNKKKCKTTKKKTTSKPSVKEQRKIYSESEIIKSLETATSLYTLDTPTNGGTTVSDWLDHFLQNRGRFFMTVFPIFSTGIRNDTDFQKHMNLLIKIPDKDTYNSWKDLVNKYNIPNNYRFSNGMMGMVKQGDKALAALDARYDISEFLSHQYPYTEPTDEMYNLFWNNFSVDKSLIDPVTYSIPQYTTKEHLEVLFKRRGHVLYLNYDDKLQNYSYKWDMPELPYLSTEFYERGMYISFDSNMKLSYLEFYDGVVYDPQNGVSKIDHTVVMRAYTNLELLVQAHLHWVIGHAHVSEQFMASYANIVYKNHQHHCLNPVMLPLSMNVLDINAIGFINYANFYDERAAQFHLAHNLGKGGFRVLYSDDLSINKNILEYVHFPSISARLHGLEAPVLITLQKWWDIMFDFISKYISLYYTDQSIMEDVAIVDWIKYVNSLPGVSFKGGYLESLKHLVTTMYFFNVLHDLYANPTVQHDYLARKTPNKVRVDGRPNSLYDDVMIGQAWMNVIGETFKYTDKSLSYLVKDNHDQQSADARSILDEFYENIQEFQRFLEADDLDHNKWLVSIQPKNIECAVGW